MCGIRILCAQHRRFQYESPNKRTNYDQFSTLSLICIEKIFFFLFRFYIIQLMNLLEKRHNEAPGIEKKKET